MEPKLSFDKKIISIQKGDILISRKGILIKKDGDYRLTNKLEYLEDGTFRDGYSRILDIEQLEIGVL